MAKKNLLLQFVMGRNNILTGLLIGPVNDSGHLVKNSGAPKRSRISYELTILTEFECSTT